MRKIFRYLHQKPKHVRDGYAFGAASIFTGVVFLFWFISFPSIDGNQPTAATEEGNAAFSTLLKQSKEQLAQLRDSVSDNVVEENSNTSSSTENVGIVLSPEDITKAQQDLQKGGEDNNLLVEEEMFEEVIIGTTTTKTTEKLNYDTEESVTTVE